MNKELTSRFLESIDCLKSNNQINSVSQFAQAIGVHRQCISDMINQKRKVNVDILQKSIVIFKLNPSYLFLGTGHMFLDVSDTISTNPSANNIDESLPSIKYVPYEVQDEYPTYIEDNIFLEQLKAYHFPDLKSSRGEHRCFDIVGDNMEPTLFNGEKIVCSLIDRTQWASAIKKNYVYFLVTANQCYTKRVENIINGERILLKNDNSFYDSEIVDLDAIKEVWQVTSKISPFMPSPNNIRNALHKEVDNLRMTISDQSKMIRSLNLTVEKLLKQNRQATPR